MFVTLQGGVKVAMPKYYRDQIFTDQEKIIQRDMLRDIQKEQLKKLKKEFDQLYNKNQMTFEDYLESQQLGELHQFNRSLKKRK